MRYQSNLVAPDLAPYFRLLDPPIQHCGHDVPSDPDYEPTTCGYFTHDEAAILYHIARQVRGDWVDVGARFGWTAMHLLAAGCASVLAVDPEYRSERGWHRLFENTKTMWIGLESTATPSPACFREDTWHRDGIVIDGNHDAPNPLNDVQGALTVAKPDCIFVLHDFITGLAVRDAVRFLMDLGFHCRLYWTPNGVACCWRGLADFCPPDHVSDPALAESFASHRGEMTDMREYWERCE